MTSATPVQELEDTHVVTSAEITLARATDLSKSSLAGEYYKNQPYNVLYAMEIAAAFNIRPAAAIQHIHIFPAGNKLQVALSTHMMATLARRAGHILQVSGTQNKAKAILIRGDLLVGRMLKGEFGIEQLKTVQDTIAALKELGLDPKELGVNEIVWDMNQAQNAGLTGKENWRKYPASMLRARAQADVIRAGAAEVLLGLLYTADELGAETDEDGVPLITEIGRSHQIGSRASHTQAKVPTPASTPVKVAATHTGQSGTPGTHEMNNDTAAAGWGRSAPAPAPAPKPQEAQAASQQADPIKSFIANSDAAGLIAWSVSNSGEQSRSAEEKQKFSQQLHTELGRSGDAQKIADWSALMSTAQLSRDEKKLALGTTYFAAQRGGRLNDEVKHDGAVTSLDNALKTHIQPHINAA